MTPWDSIHIPSGSEEIISRRIDGAKLAEFWWFRDHKGREGLLLSLALETESLQQLPVFKDMLVERIELPQSIHLRWTLLDQENREVFLTFCNSLLEKCHDLESSNAAGHAVHHTNSWKRLLCAARNPLLTVQQQLGLLGEMIALRNLLEIGIAEERAVEGWKGPDYHPKDFIMGDVALEAKAVTSSMRNTVLISSEHQLDTLTHQNLFLIIVEIEQDSGPEGLNIQEWVSHLEQNLEGPNVIRCFKDKIQTAGLLPEHDYSAQGWVVLGIRLFHVTDDFPRIDPSNIMQGIESVSYSLSLSDVTEHSCTLDTLRASLFREI